MCCCDYEPAEFFRCVQRTAKKPHECCECYGDIVLGDVYEYVSGKWDGDFTTIKTCAPCVLLRTRLSADEHCWLYGGIHDALYEADRTPEDEAWLAAREVRAVAKRADYEARRQQREADFAELIEDVVQFCKDYDPDLQPILNFLQSLTDAGIVWWISEWKPEGSVADTVMKTTMTITWNKPCT